MSFSPTILAQFRNLIDRLDFDRIIKNNSGNKYVKKITCDMLLTILIYTNLAEIKSMRHLQSSLGFMSKKHYHLGLCTISLNGISQALMHRPSEVFRDLFYSMKDKFIQKESKIYKNCKKFISIIDSTSMPLSGTGSVWAKAGKQRCEARAHCLIDADGKPLDMVVTGASVHETRGFRELNLGKTEILLMDRAYYGFNLWGFLDEKGIIFVTRAKDNMRFEVISSRPGRKPKGIVEDQIIRFYSNSKKEYLTLRRIKKRRGRGFITFISNDLESHATVIADLYKMRWDIESFFKWIKQNLKIKRFFGRNRNAIEIQLWVAMIVYLMLHLIKNFYRVEKTILWIIRIIKHFILDHIEIGNMLSPPKSSTCQSLVLELEW